ncbi:MAG: hypothetical protein WCL11_00620 [Verrucomicrobiota bacterium]
MKKLISSLCLLAMIPILLTGCASTQVTRVTPGGNESLTTSGMDIADFQATALKMVDSLLGANVLPPAGTPPANIAVSLVRNSTSKPLLNMNLLTSKITIALSKNGRARTWMNVGIGPDGKPLVQDPIGKATAQQEEWEKDSKAVRRADFSLSGEIIETYARAGNRRENTYTIHLKLAKGNLAVWEEEQEVAKQTK